ncbi:hypothetical protein AnigIFM62618_005319 [Aspergillus niger]|nr:hypothetical protein AnigIFM62618_005319 [Aspergillus niger]
MSDCCVKGFEWDGTPVGAETKLAGYNTYVTGSNSEAAILFIHDLFGWTFSNARLLADIYAQEINATVYVPDFFGGEVIPADTVRDFAKLRQLDMPAFLARNSKITREHEIVECAQALRSKYRKLGTIGFCFGGWGVFRLGAKRSAEDNSTPLVDCISTAHPSLLELSEIENVKVPVQILAPENDMMFKQELKDTCNRVIPSLGLPYDYQFFPRVEHGFAIRGNRHDKDEMEAMVRAKSCAVYWFKYWFHSK